MELTQTLLNDLKISYRQDCTLAELSTFKVGGPAELVFYPETVEQRIRLIRFSKDMGKKLIFLGNGSNILGSDNGGKE